MKAFNTFYTWGLDAKYRMGIYTVALICFKALAELWRGIYAVNSLIMLEMLLVSLVFASLETAIFPKDMEWEKHNMKGRTLLWAALANGIYIGASLLFGWFADLPLWWDVLLIVMLELCIVGMWYAFWLLSKKETRDLNQQLKVYQQKEKAE